MAATAATAVRTESSTQARFTPEKILPLAITPSAQSRQEPIIVSLQRRTAWVQFYGMKEFDFEDVDGYTITIAQKMG